MSNKGSTAWLIIFLCGLTFGLILLVVSNKQQNKVRLLNEEIKRLQNQIETTKKMPGVEELKESTISGEAAPSSLPLVATSSAIPSPVVQIQENTSTEAGTRE